MVNPIIMHVNYCEQGQSIMEMCKKAVAWGFDGIEFRRVTRGLKYDSQEKYLDDIAEAVEKSGLKYPLFGYPTANLMLPSKPDRKKEINEAVEFFSSALKRFPLTVVNAFSGELNNLVKSIPYIEYEKHGSFCATEDHWRQAIEGFKTLGKFAEENNFKFALETHMAYLHDLPQVAKNLVDRIASPAVGVNLDYGNTIYFSAENILPLPETIKTIGKSLFYLHLKNSIPLTGTNNKRIPTALSDGAINHREYMRLVRQSGFSGPICIEAPRPGDREWYAVQDINYLKSVIGDISKEN